MVTKLTFEHDSQFLSYKFEINQIYKIKIKAPLMYAQGYYPDFDVKKYLYVSCLNIVECKKPDIVFYSPKKCLRRLSREQYFELLSQEEKYQEIYDE